MNYNKFRSTVWNWPLIFSRDLTSHQPNKQAIRNQLERWHARKLLIKLRRGIFLLNQNDRKLNPSRSYIANQLFSPSYVSLEYALGYYDLIPERVSDVTSITTKKTLRLRNEVGTFMYQHIKPAAFRGFTSVKDEAGLVFFIAEPEKALVDFLYLNLRKFQGDYETVFENYFRVQNLESLNQNKIINFTGLFNSNKLTHVSRSLCKLIKEERKKR